ncbi:hybrid sensor histidine kinase/response regulator [Halohasta salina]|uniref:hybrid sensor histidine kinase/response regulator n=1 Tax=Halohasta salina TaxID=2961621 RepID=UPI0020A54399|nr:ATP-binding protein [Halohasta salina]
MSNDRSARHGHETRSPPAGRSSAEPTVLYVDGDEGRRETETTRLAAALDPVAVRAAESGAALGESLAAADCVVSRYELPDTDGIALSERVRDRAPGLPFVLAVGDGSERLASEATAAGVTDYVPVDGIPSERLVDRVAAALAERRRLSTRDGIENAVEHAADAILLTDIEGTIEYVNPAFEELTGFSRSEAVGRTPRILKSGAQDEGYYQELWATILDGNVWEEEVVNETKSGEEYVAHQTIAPVTDADGELEQFVGIQRDVTRRCLLEEQIERSAETLERLYAEVADETTDLQSKIESLLDIGATHLDYPLGYLTRIDDDTQRIIAAVGDHDAIQPGATDPIERTYCRRTVTSDEPTIVSDAPREGWADDPAFEHFGLRCYVGARIVINGEVFGTLCFGGEEPREELVLEAQQSTVKTLATWLGSELERHRYEARLERQNTQLERFASVASHDLRNPLNVASGHLEMARETGADEHFEAVAENHDRMATIIDDVLTLARQGTFVETTEPVSLQSIATECWEGVETEGAELVVDGETTIQADAGKLRHVFENLFRNALEHGTTADTDHAGEGLTVTVGPTDGGFYVADDGPGIPPADREHVFDHGYSGSDGTGFGLAIVDSIADAHGWSVHVTESRSGGARFEFVVDGTGHADGDSPTAATIEWLRSSLDEL